MARICASQGLRSIALLLATVFSVTSLGAISRAEDARAKPSRAKAETKAPTTTVDMFDGMKSGDIEVKLIASDATKGNVMITNKTKQPISVKLPKAFAGVPVLAQFRGPGAFNGNNFNGNNNVAANGHGRGVNGANQAMGGGFNQGSNINGGANGMVNGMNNGMNNGFMNIPPEKTAKVRVPLVCLEHGKADPRATIPYEIKPIDSFTKNVAVQQLCAMLGDGKVEQRVAQVAAWHLANGLSYDDLAAKQLEEFGSPPRPFFTSQEMEDAVAIVDKAEDQAEQVEKEAKQSIAQKSTSPDLAPLSAVGETAISPVSTAAAGEKPVARRRIRSR
jgi:hypothetical protein